MAERLPWRPAAPPPAAPAELTAMIFEFGLPARELEPELPSPLAYELAVDYLERLRAQAATANIRAWLLPRREPCG